MRRLRRHLLSLPAISIAAILAAGYCYFSPVNQRARLELISQDVDFGEMVPQEEKTLRFSFRNIGARSLETAVVRTSCGCSQAEFDRNVIPPHETATLTVVFKAQSYAAAVAHSVVFNTNDPDVPESAVRFHGLVRWPVDAEPVALYCGSLIAGTRRDRQVSVSSVDGSEFKILGVSASAPFVRVEPQKSDASQVHRLQVSISSGQIGAFQEHIDIKTDCARRPTIRLPVSGEYVSAQNIVPKRLLLPATDCHSLVIMRFMIHTALDAPPRLDAVTCRNADWRVTEWKLSETGPGNHQLTVTAQVPSNPGYSRTAIILSGPSKDTGTELIVSCPVGIVDGD